MVGTTVAHVVLRGRAADLSPPTLELNRSQPNNTRWSLRPLTTTMQSMPWLLRQSIRTGINTSRTSLPVRSPVSPFPLPKSFRYTGNTRRDFSVCLRCQFRSQPALFSDEIKRSTDGKPEEKSRDVDNPLATPDGSREGETDAGAQGTPQAADTVHTQGQEGKGKVDTSRSESGGLPSYLEDRRSQFSKQFSTVMDNVQSNVFVAGQRLNDLTGYSSIEALKRSIHEQGWIFTPSHFFLPFGSY